MRTPSFFFAVIVGWMLLHPQQSLDKLGRVHEVLNQFQHGIALIGERYNDTTKALVLHVLPYEAARDAGMYLYSCYAFGMW